MITLLVVQSFSRLGHCLFSSSPSSSSSPLLSCCSKPGYSVDSASSRHVCLPGQLLLHRSTGHDHHGCGLFSTGLCPLASGPSPCLNASWALPMACKLIVCKCVCMCRCVCVCISIAETFLWPLLYNYSFESSFIIFYYYFILL